MSAYYNEIDPKAAAWLRELIKQGHIAPGEVDERSIEDVTPNELMGFTQCHFFAGIGVWSHALRLSGWPDDKPVWTGSCPCQPFSAAGKGKGFDDERHLWPSWYWLIKQCRPNEIFGEQVAGKAGETWLDLVSNDLESISYTFGAAITSACGYGAPHRRNRLYWVADSECKRQSKQRVCGENTSNIKTKEFRQTDRMVDAVRRDALPFLCSEHDGVKPRVGKVCLTGLGNSIVSTQAQAFIESYMESVEN